VIEKYYKPLKNEIAMRKLKLQVNISLDGYVARPDGRGDWIFINGIKDDASFQRVIDLAESIDTILMGRKMTREFVDYWENVVDNQPDGPESFRHLAQLMVDKHKIVFSHTETEIEGRNVEVENGDLATAVNALKNKPGKDMIVYGGAGFVSSLISLDLIDEYYIIVNPVAIGSGMPIFKEQKLLTLESSTAYKNGKVLNKYVRG
jgi:dihydrofolate reductase